ncbi:MAG: stage III sporulation protein AG [Dorea sp.]
MEKKINLTRVFQKVKNLKKDQILILFLVGVLLLVIAVPVNEKKENDYEESMIQSFSEKEEAYTDETAYVTRMERELENLLTQMEGVGDAAVMITLQSSTERIVEKDVAEDHESISEADSQGGTRNTTNSVKEESTIYGTQGTDEQTPYVSKEIMPQVEGVVVIAQGGDDTVVVKNITEVIQALFGIDTHKIRIVKKN